MKLIKGFAVSSVSKAPFHLRWPLTIQWKNSKPSQTLPSALLTLDITKSPHLFKHQSHHSMSFKGFFRPSSLKLKDPTQHGLTHGSRLITWHNTDKNKIQTSPLSFRIELGGNMLPTICLELAFDS